MAESDWADRSLEQACRALPGIVRRLRGVEQGEAQRRLTTLFVSLKRLADAVIDGSDSDARNARQAFMNARRMIAPSGEFEALKDDPEEPKR